ncbi:ATP-binding cassette domain-containing protein [Streptomyces pseudovenezuelae]|uniref:ABC-type sugar transport system ATPase subunit n=1 Tax=Streptomyces pseudovenezuelae TaxID=67350 RepID=A0ABT6L8Z7_9ACTN|nr:ATP-binding cassette domain-containing protein [Streptomyces pseudovenezuelae]MDH6212758.1 ABC-type sugar transport system ATPase subunit [Streptomyces pseudovenezuelae]
MTPANNPAVEDRPAAVLRVRGVSKSFGGAAALKGVDLDLYPGEIHALMGMNGAGKSTLVQILSGIHQADGGTIEVDGHVQHGLTVRKARRLGIASVPQRRELAMGLTVAENVMLGDLPTRGRTVRWRTVRQEARRALHGLGIDIDVERTAGSLSVAEQTMVEVAREVRRGGRILILDEPTACLSAESADQIRALVRTLRDEGVAVVYISHYIDEVMAVADRLTVLRDGGVVRTARASEMDHVGLIRAMVGRDVVSTRPERPTPKDEVGISVRGLTHGRAIRDFTVDVRKGEIVAVLGPAGDAQSRLFDLLSGRQRPDHGQLQVEGRPVPFGRVPAALASRAPFYPPSRRPAKARIVVIDEVPQRPHVVYQVLFADRYLEGNVTNTLRQLTKRAKDLDEAAVTARRTAQEQRHTAELAAVTAAETKAADGEGIDPVLVAATLRTLLDGEDAIVVDETITHSRVVKRHMQTDAPDSYFYVQGGLGQGIAVALGVKLAAPQRPVVLTIGDGAFAYNPVIQSYDASKAYELPLLIVVFNNRVYKSMNLNHRRFYPDGAAAETGEWLGTDLHRLPRLAQFAEPFGMHTETVDTTDALVPALERALKAVAEGTTAVVDVLVTR